MKFLSLPYIFAQKYRVYSYFLPIKMPISVATYLHLFCESLDGSVKLYRCLKKLFAYILLNSAKDNRELSKFLLDRLGESRLNYICYSVGNRLLKSRIYGPSTERLLKAGCENNGDLVALFRYLEYLTQAHGYNHLEIKRLLGRLKSKAVLKHGTANQRIRALTLLLNLGEDEAAGVLYETLPKDYIRNGRLPLYVQSRAYALNWQGHLYNKTGADAFARIVASRATFEDYIRANKNDFCVVGNGPGEMGKGCGAHIDGHSVVIRFNNYTTDLEDDYGSRQDIWVRVANSEITSNRAENNRYTIIAANNFEQKRAYPLSILGSAIESDHSMAFIPQRVFAELIGEIHCLPSTGLAFLYWLYLLVGKIPKEKIYGFTHIAENCNYTSHYFTDTIKIKRHTHNWSREEKMLDTILT